MKILTKMLKENPKEVFLPKYFTRLPYSRPNDAKDFVDFLNWGIVQKVVEKKMSILRVVKDGVLTKESTDINFDEAKTYYKQGHTLLLRYAERSHPLLKMLADDFSESFKTEVDIQLYCTPEGHNAFGWHYDVEDVFIIQTRGSKRYTIRPNTVHPRPLLASMPEDLEYEKESGELFLDILLKEGDWLYIPSGWWHVARTQTESMHISIGLMPRSAIDILNFLPKYMAHQPYWRLRLPFHKDFNNEEDEIKFYQETFQRLGEDLATHVMDPHFIREFLSHINNKKSQLRFSKKRN
ncbi:MAG: cupin domain-containing protein [Bacteriovorax sp.]|nr:cupin domain-containing protein [Bacteriovorax sp.]